MPFHADHRQRQQRNVRAGRVIGIVGLAGMGLNYPLYKHLLAKGKQKYAFEIMELVKRSAKHKPKPAGPCPQTKGDAIS